MTRPQRPRAATPDEVRISRHGEYGVIEFIDPSVASTNLHLGSEVAAMSDREILDQYNDMIARRDAGMASYRHVAVEIPPGSPQVAYFEKAGQWCPRGDVLRCVVHHDGPDNQAIIEIDGRDFSLEEFGRMLTTYAGWGMRLCFVPDHELEKQPEIFVTEPDEDVVD